MTAALPKPLSPTHVPTLTEVIDGQPVPADGPAASAERLHAEITQRVLVELQQRLQLELAQRLPDLLAPAFARTVDALVHDAQAAAAGALAALVSDAVADELAKRRSA